MNKSVTIIIPTLDRNEILVNTLKDVLAQDYDPFDIVVVDQTEKTQLELLNFIKNYPKKIKYIRISQKSSPHARNIGVSHANGEIVLFLDDDIEINEKNFIEYHLENYSDLEVGMVGGRVIHSLNEKPSESKEVGKFKFCGLKEVTNFNALHKTEIQHAMGGNFSCYKNIYQEVGGFSEVYKGNAHMEETDFSLRVRRAGYKIMFEPRAFLLHLAYKSGGNRTKDIYEFRYWLVHNSTVFYLRNFSKILFPIFFVNKFFWVCSSSIKRRDLKMFKTMYGALTDAIKYYKKIS